MRDTRNDNLKNKQFYRQRKEAGDNRIENMVILAGKAGMAYSGSTFQDHPSESFNGSTRLLGLSLLQRIILAAKRAGIKRIFLLHPSNEELTTIKDLLAKTGTIANDEPEVVIHSVGTDLSGFFNQLETDTFVLLSGNIVFHPDLLKSPHLLPQFSHADSPRICRCRISQLKEFLDQFHTIADSSGVHRSTDSLPTEQEPSSPTLEPEQFFCHIVTDAKSFKCAEKDLLQTARKPSDGFIYKNFNRPISLQLTRFLLRLIPEITPNQISVFNLFPALAAAFFMALGGYVNALVGSILFHLSSVLDGCDGENARLTYRVSGKGAWIDTICDVIAYFAFLTAIPTGLYRSTGNILYPLMGVETVLFIVLLYVLMTRYVKAAGSGGSMIKIVKDIERSGNQSNSVFSLHKIVSRSAFIFRRDFFAFGFMVLCVFGALPLIMVLLALLAPFAVGYLFFFSKKQFKEVMA